MRLIIRKMIKMRRILMILHTKAHEASKEWKLGAGTYVTVISGKKIQFGST